MPSPSTRKELIIWYAISVVVILLDQVTKYAADNMLDYGRPVEILPVFDLTLLYNKGAAFSFLSDAGGWQRWFFLTISSVVSCVLVVWIYRLPSSQKLLALSLSLILGGAIGNLIDRAYFGHVIDFISVHYDNHYFPAFNIADSAITVGAALMLIEAFFFNKEEENQDEVARS